MKMLTEALMQRQNVTTKADLLAKQLSHVEHTAQKAMVARVAMLTRNYLHGQATIIKKKK